MIFIGLMPGKTFQSTRPQGARRFYPLSGASSVSVSIHAPAGGATSTASPCLKPPSGFNPRARRGRDVLGAADADELLSFNPRARRGRDNTRWLIGLFFSVSIHAPAGGATRYVLCGMGRVYSFNPRARRGRDFNAPDGVRSKKVSIHAPAGGATGLMKKHVLTYLFQSTRPQGARHTEPVGFYHPV